MPKKYFDHFAFVASCEIHKRKARLRSREGAALQRENRRLRSQVASLEERGAGGHGQPAATPGKPRQRASERIPG